MNAGGLVSAFAAQALHFSPTEWLRSWLLYLGIQTHVGHTSRPDMYPLHNVCEYLNALHIYTEEARQGIVRTVDAHHYCSHVRKGGYSPEGTITALIRPDLRQCLIYDSCKPNARLIGVEYMIPREKYDTLDPTEQRLWHSHNFEVKSGMLVLPYPSSHQRRKDEWDALETEAMGEVVNLYGKLFHFWQVDKGHDLPLGMPMLMGSLTDERQLDVDQAMSQRNSTMGIDMVNKRRLRESIESADVPANADEWWKEAEDNARGVYE